MPQGEDNGEDGMAEGPEGDTPMSFFDHLGELRKRLVRSAFSLAAAMILCYVFVDDITRIITTPYAEAWKKLVDKGVLEGPVGDLINTGTLEPFLVDLRLALYSGLFLAAPFLFYHLWMFIAPGLYKKEKLLVVPFVATSAVMFIGGAAFCFYLVLPIATEFFLEYPLKKAAAEGEVGISALYTYAEYTSYTTKLLLGFGLMFEFPLAVYFLARAGLVTHMTLLRYYKVIIVVIALASAFFTPPDPLSMVLLLVPMVIMFFASVGVAYLVSKPERERLAQFEAELADADDADLDDEDDGEE